jgi:hypothetical protein
MKALRTIAAAGTIVGILDAISAIVVFGWFGASPARIFKGIAFGVLGPAALTGGTPAVIVGVIAHFTVAFGAAATYYGISRLRPATNDHPLVAGPLFGAAVHLFMNFVVVPLSAIGPRPIVWAPFLAGLVVHLIVVGPTIAITVSKLR